MEQIVADWRSAAEVLGFVKDVVITAAVVFGATQVLLARQTLEVTRRQQADDQKRNRDAHERASKTVALDAASRFANSFGPKYIAFIQEVAQAGLGPYRGQVTDFKFSGLEKSYQSAAYQRSRLPSSSGALDELEVFAAAHTTGVADGKTGFLLNGRMFCAAVAEDFYDLICIEQDQGFYHAIVELYREWSPRLTREQLTKSKELVELQKKAFDQDAEARRAALEAQKKLIDTQLKELPESDSRPPIGLR